MSPVRIAVIGAGLIGRKHIDVLRGGVSEYTLAGVADPSPKAEAEAAELGYPCYATVEALLDATRPEGAVIALPNQLHVQTGLECIERGIGHWRFRAFNIVCTVRLYICTLYMNM